MRGRKDRLVQAHFEQSSRALGEASGGRSRGTAVSHRWQPSRGRPGAPSPVSAARQSQAGPACDAPDGAVTAERHRKQCTTNSRHGFRRFPNLVANRFASALDDVWVCDLTSVRLGAEFIYLAMILDQYTRDIRGWQLGRTLAQALTLTALQRRLMHRTPVIRHLD